MPHVPELDYMAYISFEVYERSKDDEKKELAVRLSLSEGAHSAVLDSSLDAKHALQVQPRRKLTGQSFHSCFHRQWRELTCGISNSEVEYVPLDSVIEILERHSKFAAEKFMQRSTTAFEGLLIEGDEVYRGLPRQLEIVREFKSHRPRSLFSGSDKEWYFDLAVRNCAMMRSGNASKSSFDEYCRVFSAWNFALRLAVWDRSAWERQPENLFQTTIETKRSCKNEMSLAKIKTE